MSDTHDSHEQPTPPAADAPPAVPPTDHAGTNPVPSDDAAPAGPATDSARGHPTPADRGADDARPGTPCPYLADRWMRSEAYVADAIDGATYELLMARWFRRSGRVVYRPRCPGCQACRPLRVPVTDFRRTRSMRRVWSRNRDVRVHVESPAPSMDKFDIYRRYLDMQHDNAMARTFEAFVDFLYDSPLPMVEFDYYAGRRLIGVSLADRCPGGLSSVYMYFHPTERTRSLGTYSILWEIEHTRGEGLPYYYLGYHVAGSKTMDYKARFRPNEVLADDDRWVPFRV